MPRDVNIWQLTEPDEGYEICDTCEGWGGRDWTVCHGFGAREDWHTCWECAGRGQNRIEI